MTKMRKRILGIGCAAVFALSQIPLAFHAESKLVASADAANTVSLETYGGGTLSVQLTEDGKLPELPTPERVGYDFVGWFTDEVTVEYWGDDDAETWTKLKEKYGNESAGYTYLNGKTIGWYNTAETPSDPENALPQGENGAITSENGKQTGYYDWQNSRWIENSVGIMNATKGQRAEKGMSAEAGSTLYAMYDPKNITVYWYNNGWGDSHDGDYASTGHSTGFEYGGKFAYLPLDRWQPWEGHAFKGWVDAEGNPFGFDMGSLNQNLSAIGGKPVDGYSPETYEPVLRLYATYDGVTSAESTPKNAEYAGVVGNGGWFDVSRTYTFTAVFDSRYKIYPEIGWELAGGEELFDLSVSADKTKATVSVKPEYREELVENTQVTLRLTVGNETFEVYATASHEWNNGKILSGLWDRCTSPMTVEYTCKLCGQTKTKEFPADGHRYTRYRTEATCTEDAVEERYCVVCGKTEREILAGTATGHNWDVKKVSGCGGTVTTSICKTCGLTETQEDHTACHSWNSFYTVDRAATCTSEGSKSVHCAHCGAVKDSVAIPATGHSYKETSHAATCTESGYTVRTCTACGDTVRETTSAPTGHNFAVSTQTGCKGATYTVKTCKTCGAVETEGDKAALAHTPAKDYAVEKAPTCTEAGERVLLCAACGETLKRETVPATGHRYETTSYEATCTQGGYTVSVCSVCGDRTQTQGAAAKGHDFAVDTQTGCCGATYTVKTCKTCGTVETEGDKEALAHAPAKDYTVEKAPTCTEAGERVLRCTKCGDALDSEVLPAAGHSYETTEHAATCTEDGYTEKVCSVCGDCVTETVSEAHGHVAAEAVTETSPEGSVKNVYCAACGCLLETQTLPPEPAPEVKPETVPEKSKPLPEADLVSDDTAVPEERAPETVPEKPEPLPQTEPVGDKAEAPGEDCGTTLPVQDPQDELAGELLAVGGPAERTDAANGAWIWIALLTVCGAAALCVPVAVVAVKRRK